MIGYKTVDKNYLSSQEGQAIVNNIFVDGLTPYRPGYQLSFYSGWRLNQNTHGDGFHVATDIATALDYGRRAYKVDYNLIEVFVPDGADIFYTSEKTFICDRLTVTRSLPSKS